MAQYFNRIPTIPYEAFDGSGEYKVVSDIFKRVRATLQARTDATIYYNYTIRDKETPEIISYKYYDSPQYHWVVLLMNQMADPQWDWPLDQRSFNKFIVDKYGTYAAAATTLSHYETVEVVAPVADDTLGIRKGDVMLPAGLKVKANFEFKYGVSPVQTFNSSNVRKAVYMDEYETDKNEKKRNIVLLRRNLLYEFVEEFSDLIIKKR